MRSLRRPIGDRPVPVTVSPKPVSRRARRRRGPLAIAVAWTLLLHGAILSLLFWQSSEAPTSFRQAEAGGDTGFTVSLVTLPASLVRAQSPPPATQPDLDSLAHRLSLETPANAPAPTARPSGGTGANPLLKLFDDAKAAATITPSKSASAQSAGGGASWAVHEIADRYALASVIKDDSFRTPDQTLWRQIARCWSGSSGVPGFEVKVTLNDQGGLVGPPVVLGQSASSPQLNRAEGAAQRALAQCAPYHLGGPDRVFAIRFGGPGQG